MVIGWPFPPLPLCGGLSTAARPRGPFMEPGAPHGLMPADTCSSSAGAAGWGEAAGRGDRWWRYYEELSRPGAFHCPSGK